MEPKKVMLSPGEAVLSHRQPEAVIQFAEQLGVSALKLGEEFTRRIAPLIEVGRRLEQQMIDRQLKHR